MIRKDNIVTKIEKLHGEYELLKKGRYRRSEAQISKEKDFEVLLDNLFDVAHGMRDHDDQPGGQRVPPRPTGARTSGKEGAASIPSLLLRRRGNLFAWKKAAAFSARKKEEAAASSSVAQLESSPSPAPTLQLLSQMKNTEQLRSESCEAGETGHEEHVSPATGGHAGSNQADRSFRDYVLTEAARCLGQKRRKPTSTAHPPDANA
ncbi:hypothetical protein GWK47_050327 [Chionoecetes opilio]|uniref:Uncharacterized protein n=1 Tax=Chionoecetes opilio TaxID=41210 RepID=A0A8J4Y1N9_CHIOP|nr:hypothetical protein GWK47_050327 [Chionoecetes opilio]